MHEVQAKEILSGKNGINIYRGCSHGCIYCDARSTCYQMKHEFEDIEVKRNAPELLESALSHRKKKGMIATGSMGDPYVPIEETLQLTRRCIKVVRDYGFGLAIQTKSARILRDIDLLQEINQRTKCVVEMTLTTYDEELCKKIEPGVSTTKERVEVLKKMNEAGIPTIVWLTPILPHINDNEENIRGLMEYCVEANVKGILCFNMGLTLRNGNREYYYKQLDRYYPGMKERYLKEYGFSYEVVSKKNEILLQLIQSTCQMNHMIFGAEECFKYLKQFESKEEYTQLSLWDSIK